MNRVFNPGQQVRVIAAAADRSTNRIGQIGRILHGVGDGSMSVVVAFEHTGGNSPRYSVNTFSVDALEVEYIKRK